MSNQTICKSDEKEEASISMEIHPEYERIGKNVPLIDILVQLKGLKEKREPIDLIIALDVSRSMRKKKMSLCVETIEFLSKYLNEKDRLSVIAFGGVVYEILPWRVMNERGKNELSRKLRNIHHVDGTNLYKGLTSAIFRLSNLSNRRDVSSLWLLTDGKGNEGKTDSKTIARYVKTLMESVLDGTSLFAFGYGKSHDARVLSDLTNAVQDGSYRYLRKPNEIPLALCEAMGNVMSVSGRKIRMVASVPDSRLRIAAVYTKRRFEISASKRIATVQLGNLYSGEERDVLFRLESVHPPEVEEENEGPEVEEEGKEVHASQLRNLLNVSVVYVLCSVVCAIGDSPLKSSQHTHTHTHAHTQVRGDRSTSLH